MQVEGKNEPCGLGFEMVIKKKKRIEDFIVL